MRYVDACQCQAWHLMLDIGGVADGQPFPYHCRSWRHEGPCRDWKGAQDFERVRHAVLTRSPWTYVVLTFAQSEWWDWLEQYKLAGPMWSSLRLRFRRTYGHVHYIQTWERHRKGGLHVNVLLSNQELFDDLCFDTQSFEENWLSPNSVSVGFGPVCWACNMRPGTESSLAAYLSKTAAELTGAGKKHQVPVDAPPHFRRLRASRGVLPPVYRSGLHGWLVMAPMDNIDRMHLPLCPDTL